MTGNCILGDMFLNIVRVAEQQQTYLFVLVAEKFFEKMEHFEERLFVRRTDAIAMMQINF